MHSGAAVTQVRFRLLGDDEIEAYVRSGEPLDKAGAYAVQGGAAGFVGRRKTVIVYAVLAWLVVAAVIVRRMATARFSPELIMFDGALAGYPLWSVWFAEAVRVGVNLWSLWLGARLGRWTRHGVDRGVRGLLQRGRG